MIYVCLFTCIITIILNPTSGQVCWQSSTSDGYLTSDCSGGRATFDMLECAVKLAIYIILLCMHSSAGVLSSSCILCGSMCCVLEQGTLLQLAPLVPCVQMCTSLCWDSNRLTVQRNGDSNTVT